MSKEGWEWMDEISEVPNRWSEDILKDVYENYVISYFGGGDEIYYSTNKGVKHKNIKTVDADTYVRPQEVYLILSSSKLSTQPEPFTIIGEVYVSEVAILNRVSKRQGKIELYTMDEFMKMLDNINLNPKFEPRIPMVERYTKIKV